MTRIQRLLAATDLSAPARHAAERAALVARELGAALDLLHVISVAPVDRLRRLLAEASADLEAQVAADASTEMQRLADGLHQQYQVRPTMHVEHGGLLRQIDARAEASAADMLVLGARGASFMRHRLLGSTAERMVRRTSRPMLVVKRPARGPYRRLLIPVDFSPASLPACEFARAVAPRAELVLLHAFEVPFETRLRSAGVHDETLRTYREIAQSQAERAMQSFLAAAGLPPGAVTTLVLHGDPSSLIIEQEQERDCDLVVVGRRGESMVDDFLLGSVTKHVLQESQGDVLVSAEWVGADRAFTRNVQRSRIAARSGGSIMQPINRGRSSALLVLAVVAAATAQAQPKQVVKPPVSQAWIDVATFGGFAMGGAMGPGMGQGMGNMTLGALMGGGRKATAEFGYTQTGTTGRWMDVTLYTSRNPGLAEALQGVPAGTMLAPTLKLQTPEKPKTTAPQHDEEPAPLDYEPPKGKFVLYWGCSETVRPGQPKVMNLETATLAELGKFFESRRATQRGTHSTAGRPIWPSKIDNRAIPAGASLVGQHSFTGQGVPESFKFDIPQAQDLMPEFKLRQTDKGGSLLLEWDAIPHARAYFLGSMGTREGEDMTMVLWTSSELPDSGFGLFDYQTNTAVDQWLKEKVLLSPATTQCAIPKEAAGTGMLRGIAYGTELNMAYPPRPKDPAIAWEPDWNVKIRVKSMTTTMLGMEGAGGMGGVQGMDDMTDAPAPAEGEAAAAPAEEPKKKKKGFNPFDVVKDVVKDQLP